MQRQSKHVAKSTGRPLAHARRGIATMELVFCLPVLLVLMAMVFSVGYTGLARETVTSQVRRTAWQLRNGNPGGAALALPSLLGNASVLRRDEVRRPVVTISFNPLTHHWASGRWNRIVVPRAQALVLDGAWDHRQVSFAGGEPHLGVLPRMVTETGPVAARVMGPLNAFGSLLSFPR